jgi:hypothetical protein
MQNTQSSGRPWWSKMAIYWLDRQIALTFHSNLHPSEGKAKILQSLHLDDFNQFLTMRGYTLRGFTADNTNSVSGPTSDNWDNAGEGDTDTISDDLTDLQGKHVFLHPSGQGSLITCFFTLQKISPYSTAGTSVMSNVGSIYSTNSTNYNDETRWIIDQINSIRGDLLSNSQVTILNASPNWLCAGTPAVGGCGTHGCPLSPPFPAESGSGKWHTILPDISPDLQQRTGEGVTVFVLDTRPSKDQVTNAAKLAGEQNPLLQTIAQQMGEQNGTFVFTGPDNEPFVPSVLENDNPMQPFTGRDIFGRLTGYEMSDHGLFVAGLIRDIAPGARIECLRVLNDYGVGSASVLIKALESIHNRMLKTNPDTSVQGDLYGKPIVINLSLVTTPHQEDFSQLWSGDDATDHEPLTVNLHAIIQSLTALGAVVVGSAGNDSDSRQALPPLLPTMMQTSTTRMLPRYPAAFPEVIAVGAVDGTGHAAAYSNYPVAPGSAQNNGIATYGGGMPVPSFPTSVAEAEAEAAQGWLPFDPAHMIDIDRNKLDALLGLYTADHYPALSADDVPSEYKTPNTSGWAYWSGTSFATPIISALAARILDQLNKNVNLRPYQWHHAVLKALTTGLVQEEYTANGKPLPLVTEFSQGGINVGLVRAEQTNPQTEGSTVKVEAMSAD